MDISALFGPVESVWGTRHYFADEPQSLGPLHFRMVASGWVTVRPAPGGWGIAVDSTPPMWADMGEYGELRGERLGEEDAAGRLQGRSIIKISSLVRSTFGPLPTGYLLGDDAGDTCAVWNWGDDLYYGEDWEHFLSSRGAEVVLEPWRAT
jgi:hypothetical protein